MYTLPSLRRLAPLLLLAPPALAQLPPAATPDSAAPTPELALLTTKGSGPDCTQPFGLRRGQRLEYQLLDAKGKVVGLVRYQVIGLSSETKEGKKSSRAVTTAQLKSGLYDPSNRLQQQHDLSIFCDRDTVYTDGLAEINYDGLKSFRDRRLSYEGKPLAWPNQPTAGTALRSGGATVQVSSPSVAIAKVKTTLRKRQVHSGPTPITVPAGTFSCYRVESQRELATAARADLVLKSTGRQVDYYAPSVGIVRTEYYDKAGKLLQARVLARR